LIRKSLDSPWTYFALAALLVVASAFILLVPRGGTVALKKGGIDELSALRTRDDVNVVFILIDTLRADRLHSYGYTRKTSPRMDALAARGIRFDRVESQSSWTKQSMASLWTGMYPERTGVFHFAHAVPDQALMPAEVFRDVGFRTAGIWRNGWVANNFGFGQGFDLYVKPYRNRPVKSVRRPNGTNRLPGTDVDATQSAIEFMAGNSSGRFLVYLHYMDVHQYVYADSSPNWGTSFSDIYDSSIHWVDRNVGMVVDAIEQLGLTDRTLIVISSDHGEAFFEHAVEGHARTLYREVQNVPWLIVPPFEIEGGIVVEDQVANVDVWPTILDLVGLPALPAAEGQSVVPLVLEAGGGVAAPEELKQRTVFSQLNMNWGRDRSRKPRHVVAVVREPYRLVEELTDPRSAELFDRTNDEGEKDDIAKQNPEAVETLRAEREAFLAKPGAEWDEAPEIELDEMKINQLRALGYMVPGRGARPAKGDAEARKDLIEAIEDSED
jgi:arylsulfatase A-like enzyme